MPGLRKEQGQYRGSLQDLKKEGPSAGNSGGLSFPLKMQGENVPKNQSFGNLLEGGPWGTQGQTKRALWPTPAHPASRP